LSRVLDFCHLPASLRLKHSMAALTYNGQRRYSRFDTPTSAWESNLDAKKNGMVADRKFHANSHDSPSTNGKTSIWNKKVDHRSPDTQYLDHMRRVSPQRRRSGPLSTNEQSLSPAASSRLATRRESNYRKTSIQSYQSLLQERDQLNKRAGDLDIKTHVLEHATHRESGGTEEQDKLATTTKLAHEHQVNQLKTEIKSAMDIAGAALEEAERRAVKRTWLVCKTIQRCRFHDQFVASCTCDGQNRL
jgi:hypothetical protein